MASGTNLTLSFLSNAWSDRPEDRTPTREFVDFDREVGKVSHFHFPFFILQKVYLTLLDIEGAHSHYETWISNQVLTRNIFNE